MLHISSSHGKLLSGSWGASSFARIAQHWLPMTISRQITSPEPQEEQSAALLQGQGPQGAHRVLLIFILGALSAFGPLSIDMYLPSLPALGLELTASASQTQLTLSFCLLGLALGQTIAGPISDALGRRRPLIIGLIAYALASLLCAVAPSVFLLAALRFVQGLAGAAGIVIARAIVRDHYSGIAVARFFSLLMLVNGLAPILAPIFGGFLIRFTSWRGVFIVLTIIGVFLLIISTLGIRESLPVERRQGGGMKATITTFLRLLSDRAFLGFALSSGLASAAMFAYISGSPFVLQEIYGLSPQLFSIIFGTNALGIVAMGQINGWLVGRVPLKRLLTIGLCASAIGGVSLFLVISSHTLGLIGILPALFIVVASIGLIAPNATTLALANHPRAAGSASALVGVLQYAIGAIASPLVGIAGTTNALPMAIIIAVLSLSALTTFVLLTRGPQEASASNHE